MSAEQKIEFIDVRMRAARMEIETLRRERDEARREVCECKVHQQHDPVQLAQDRGWDCFKENTNG